MIRALSALADAGKQNSADGAAIRGALANLYLQEHRYREAAAILSTALATPSLSGNAALLVRIDLLNTRALAWGRQNRWRDAESDLAEAVALCRQQPQMDSAERSRFLQITLTRSEDASQTRAIA
jgi:tetratricopeptide (TPR) repeat protein